jgi:hypothetical protein
VCTFIAAAVAGAIAQNAVVADRGLGSVDIAYDWGQPLPAPAGTPTPRFREVLGPSAAESEQTWHHLSTRIYWTRAISTRLQGGLTSWGIRRYYNTVDLPPFGMVGKHEFFQHRRSFSLVQSYDVGRWGPAVPWVGGGVLVHRTSTREVLSVPGFPRGSIFTTGRLTKDRAAIATGGVKIYLDRHMFISANGAVRLGEAPPEGFDRQWQVGIGTSFYGPPRRQ